MRGHDEEVNNCLRLRALISSLVTLDVTYDFSSVRVVYLITILYRRWDDNYNKPVGGFSFKIELYYIKYLFEYLLAIENNTRRGQFALIG